MKEFKEAKRLEQELVVDETILWEGKPSATALITKRDMIIVPLALLWSGIAFYWEYMAIQTDAPFLFKLWGIPFIFIGLYLLVGRFFITYDRRKNTTYVLTNRRAFILIKDVITSTRYERMGQIHKMVKLDGRGSIIFKSPENPMLPFLRLAFLFKEEDSNGFMEIADVETVYELMMEQKYGRLTP